MSRIGENKDPNAVKRTTNGQTTKCELYKKKADDKKNKKQLNTNKLGSTLNRTNLQTGAGR